MKKILSCVLCLAMILSLGVTAFAETNDFVLTYSNEASYEINIPASGNINKATGEGTITIEVTEANLEADSVVSITASSANYNDGWYLVNSKDSTDKINYNLGTVEGANNVASGDEILSTNTATSTTLYVTGINTSKVGTFTDTITFTSEIVSVFHLSGTWEWNETLTLPDSTLEQAVSFTCDAGSYDGFYIREGTPEPGQEYGIIVQGIRDGEAVAPSFHSTSGWNNRSNIAFVGIQSVSEEFYNWFIINAVRQ